MKFSVRLVAAVSSATLILSPVSALAAETTASPVLVAGWFDWIFGGTSTSKTPSKPRPTPTAKKPMRPASTFTLTKKPRKPKVLKKAPNSKTAPKAVKNLPKPAKK